VLDVPETQYVENADGAFLAYHVAGSGDIDVVFLPTSWTNVEIWWEDPVAARLFRRLASFGRMVTFDRRGCGLSDPVPSRAIPTVDEWVEDLMVVLNAIGSTSAHLVAADAGGAPALIAAATHPSRVSSLVLWNSFARLSRAPDYPCGFPDSVQEQVLALYAADFAGGMATDRMAPSRADNAAFRAWWARFGRHSVTPGGARLMQAAVFALDVRAVLPSVRHPALVLHARENQYVRAAHGRYLAEHLPHAKYVELDGGDHLPLSDIDRAADLIEQFVTGAPATPTVDRVLGTVVFTDIVESTERAAALGDRAWTAVLDDHDGTVQRVLQRFGGRQLKHTGDGVLALFDGPTRAIAAAIAMRDALRAANLDIRCGVHTAEIEIRGDDIGGIGVHIGARVTALAGAGQVFTTATVKDLVAGSGTRFDDQGMHTLKGITEPVHLYAVADQPL
jgi:class 3 adenylate cyclase